MPNSKYTGKNERRKYERCFLPRKTKLFLKFWPLLLACVYGIVGIWPSAMFNGPQDTFYQSLALVIAVLGIFAAIFWKCHLIRNIMASVALARSASTVLLAIFAEPQLPFAGIMRLTSAGILACIFYCLVIVEVPHIRAMSHEYRR